MTETREIVVRLQLDFPAAAADPTASVVTADQPLLYRVRDAAQLLAVGESAVHELIARGDLESVKIGASRRVTRAGIESYIRRMAGRTGDVA